ncbi:MAG TPA: thiamine pyrophosphate-requiring protein, partial [Woeseiaceae bacterium]|nr:thiamine pyrophosphate-requiring protein [Woeseiaceae bacterium]
FGIKAFSVDDPAECGDTLEEALATRGPVLIEAVVDPHEPPLPPGISAEDAKNFGEALLKGQPNRRKIALTAISDKVREMV